MWMEIISQSTQTLSRALFPAPAQASPAIADLTPPAATSQYHIQIPPDSIFRSINHQILLKSLPWIY